MSNVVRPEIGPRLDNRTALVTGAGQGLGRAIALCFARSGADVVVNDLDGERAAQTVGEIAAEGGTALAVPGDVSSEFDVERLVGAAVERFGRLDIACNNAIPPVRLGPMHELDVDDARALAAVAMLGTAICLKHQIRTMRTGGGGSIVNISSTASVRGQESTGFYAGCKAAIEAMTRVAAGENGRFQIRVNAVQAGGMMTPALRQILEGSEGARERIEGGVPLGHVAEPDEVADVALFLASDLARYVTGAVVTADGGGMLHASSMPVRG